jgi:hypothetical protein
MLESGEWRACIKLCTKLEKTGTEVYKMIYTAFREEVMIRTQIFERFHHFKDGRTSVRSDEHCDAFHLAKIN